MHGECPYENDDTCARQYIEPMVKTYIVNGLISALIFVTVFRLSLRKSISIYFIPGEMILFLRFIIFEDHVMTIHNF